MDMEEAPFPSCERKNWISLKVSLESRNQGLALVILGKVLSEIVFQSRTRHKQHSFTI